jgi:hypothetical protein
MITLSIPPSREPIIYANYKKKGGIQAGAKRLTYYPILRLNELKQTYRRHLQLYTYVGNVRPG